MSREVKIAIFSIILIYSGYLKYSKDVFSDTPKKSTTTSIPKNNDVNKNNPDVLKDLNEAIDKLEEKGINAQKRLNEFDIDSPDYTEIPKSGFSPYNNYFGKGIYHKTENSIVVTAPLKSHVVFIVIDAYSKKRIRNEFIRKGETFTMTKIPYGTYDYMYFTGRNWSNEVYINKGKVRGGFKDYPSFSRNNDNQDQMKFKTGYYGSITIKLSQTIGGNLKMSNTSESDFFQ